MSDRAKPPPSSDPHASLWTGVARMEAEVHDPDEPATNVYTPERIAQALRSLPSSPSARVAGGGTTAVMRHQLSPARKRLLEQADTEIGPVPELVRPELKPRRAAAPAAPPASAPAFHHTQPSARDEVSHDDSDDVHTAVYREQRAAPIEVHDAPPVGIESPALPERAALRRSTDERSTDERWAREPRPARAAPSLGRWVPFALLIIVGFALGYLVVAWLRSPSG
jgi:hypothetical protein